MSSFALTIPGIVGRNIEIRATRMVANNRWNGLSVTPPTDYV
jgi:hypothetical protein